MRLMLRRKLYEEPIKLIKKFQERFVSKGYLEEDLTKGPETAQYSIIEDLVSSFVSLRHKSNEDDFYIQVAKNWVNDLYSSNHKISLFLVIFYVFMLLSVFLSFDVLPGEIILLGLFLLPIFGFISAIGGRGWKRLILVLINILFFVYSIIIVV